MANYFDYGKVVRPCILRHDVDFSLKKAYDFAQMEAEENISSTYFILITSDFYNILSKNNKEYITGILRGQHHIGLHFDEMRYEKDLCASICLEEKIEKLKGYIVQEAMLLQNIIGEEVNCVSMHRPSDWVLDADVQIDGMVNSYEKKFFLDFKYLSDSRMHWREDIDSIVSEKRSGALHILTHPFWYSEEEKSIEAHIDGLLKTSIRNTYDTLDANFRDLDKVLKREVLECRLQKW